MCGIVGYSCKDPKQNHIQILQDIIAESSIRGIHSFGYSFVKDKKLITRKYHDLKEVKLPLTNKLIYHNRYSTSGDFKNHKNNQPIHIDNMSLVFNGVIDMRTKKLIERFVNDIRGSFAGIILDEKENLFVIRNKKRPCWILEYDNAKFVASTRDIFKRVDNAFMPKPLEANKIYEI